MGRLTTTLLASAVALTGCGVRVTRTPYADGYLPVGDGMYVTDHPRKGYAFACEDFAEMMESDDSPGAEVRGPWFTPDGQRWNPDLKPHIQGDVPLPGRFDMTMDHGMRVIVTNGLPVDHTVGKFPVDPSDPAYKIDPNPNTIEGDEVTYRFPAHPYPAIENGPACVGHQVGVMTRGAALFAPLDARGRDAVAWEVQDHCDGHPDPMSTYHYHGISDCLPGTDTDAVVGFAVDGFPITGNRDQSGREILSRELDECHGTTGDITLDGEHVNSYHYVMTRDYPYTVACLKGRETEWHGEAVS